MDQISVNEILRLNKLTDTLRSELAAKDKEIDRLKERVAMLEAKIENLAYDLMEEDE